ncbi:hypothetical protein HK096_007414, partial [Nowakowskiella sp. JEL0078]
MLTYEVGDFVLLRNNESIPADLVVISSSEKDCLCYVETKNLDGETNLKIRRGVSEMSWIQTPEDCTKVQCFFDCENPNPNLYGFNGLVLLNPVFPESKVKRKDSRTSQPKSSLDKTNEKLPQLRNPDLRTKLAPISTNGILLRGCILRNTKWVIGVAIYTGSDTKIMLNSGITPSKRSKIEKQMNPQILLNFMILFAMCLICAVTGAVYVESFDYSDAPWFDVSSTESPMYTAFCLGQIEYIFSDKTGTLTSNVMQFKKCSINGMIYGGDSLTEGTHGAAVREGNGTINKKTHEKMMLENENSMRENMARLFTLSYIDEKLAFIDPNLHEHILTDSEQGRRIREFFTLLAVCHTVLVEKDEGKIMPEPVRRESFGNILFGKIHLLGEKRIKKASVLKPLLVSETQAPSGSKIHLQYNAQSPDEAALVNAAKNIGIAFLHRDENHMTINVFGEIRTYIVLHVIEFNSDRKRMSVIIQRPEGEIVLLCKGADSVIYERLSKDQNRHVVDLTSRHLEQFAND